MDRAEAIRKIEYGLEMETSEMTPFGQLTVVRTDALKVALAALREQEQREQGCKYCREYESIVEVNGDFISFDETISKGIFLEACTCDVVLEAKVPFCPMCGRKLKEGVNDGH